MQRVFSHYVLYATTLFTFTLAGLCFYRYAETAHIAWLLLGWVTFGTAFDYSNHILGLHFGQHKSFLIGYGRVNFGALCFGIPFTALAASFVVLVAVSLSTRPGAIDDDVRAVLEG